MPYIYPVEVRGSPIEGQGLFAAVDIPKGAVYWVYHCEDPLPIEGVTIQPNEVLTKEELEAKRDPGELHLILASGIYLKDWDVFLNLRDGSYYMNHSFTPNGQIDYPESRDYRDLVSYALRDIKAGEEITESYQNYLNTNSNWVPDLMKKYSLAAIEFE